MDRAGGVMLAACLLAAVATPAAAQQRVPVPGIPGATAVELGPDEHTRRVDISIKDQTRTALDLIPRAGAAVLRLLDDPRRWSDFARARPPGGTEPRFLALVRIIITGRDHQRLVLEHNLDFDAPEHEGQKWRDPHALIDHAPERMLLRRDVAADLVARCDRVGWRTRMATCFAALARHCERGRDARCPH